MKRTRREFMTGASCICVGLTSAQLNAETEEIPSLPKAYIDGTGEGWKAMAKEDFANVNCSDDTRRN